MPPKHTPGALLPLLTALSFSALSTDTVWPLGSSTACHRTLRLYQLASASSSFPSTSTVPDDAGANCQCMFDQHCFCSSLIKQSHDDASARYTAARINSPLIERQTSGGTSPGTLLPANTHTHFLFFVSISHSLHCHWSLLSSSVVWCRFPSVSLSFPIFPPPASLLPPPHCVSH